MTIKKHMNITIFTLTLAIFIISFSSFASANEKDKGYSLTASSSFNYISGSYGQTIDTFITYIPLTTKIKTGPWTAKLTIPYIKITGPGVVVGGGATVVSTAGTKATQSGLGDIITSLGYTVPFKDYAATVSLLGKVKLPTADDKKKLGTGNTDYTLQVGFTKMLGDAYVNGSVARKFNGTSAAYNLNDVWKYSLGLGYKLDYKTTIGGIYSFRQASTATSSNFSQIIGYTNYKITDDLSTQLYVGGGFTNSSPDFLTGLELKYKFDTSIDSDIW